MMKQPILLALGTALLLQAQAVRTRAANASDLLKEGCLFSYLPDDNRFYAKIEFIEKWLHSPAAVALGKQCRSAVIRVTRAGESTPLLEHSLSIANGVSSEVQLALPPLTGKCEVRFDLSGLPEVCTVTKSFERQRFAWEGNHLGITAEIYPPYEPVRVEGKTVFVVSRRYTMNEFGLWDGIRALDRNILAAPIRIRYTTVAGEGVWSGADVALDSESSTPQQAVFTATATSRAVQVKTVSTVEFDGCMKVEMELQPGEEPTEIQQLWIDVPLKSDEAPLFHEVSDYIRKNYSGFTPGGEGTVWSGTRSRRTAKWLNPFTSYIWLGAEERGLCWFAENDRNWITEHGDKARPLQELIRHGNVLTLRVYLVNQPTPLKGKHAIVFGLQASPTKPMETHWRAKTTTLPGGSGPVNPWGGLHCGYKGPYHNDWQIVDKIIEAQKSDTFDATWFKEYVARHNPPPCYGNWEWLESCRVFARMRERPAMTYQEELIQSVLQPEWLTFQDQWRDAGTLGTEMSEFTTRQWPTEDIFREKDPKQRQSNPSIYVNHCRSYQDYGCWYANEWFKRGVSAYWDNTFPKYTYNTRNSAAYRTADGQVQPAMVIWNEREYMKRVWNLLQFWRRHQPEPLEWSHHMTDALILPLQTWATVILDYELDANAPYPPEMHRAQAIGRQVGAIPYWLYTPVGNQNPIWKERDRSEIPGRADWGMKVVHEALRTGYTGASSLTKNERGLAPQLEKILVDFGYTNATTVVHNYWEEHPVLEVDKADVKWIALERAKALLIVLQSWSTNDTQVIVRLNPGVPGPGPDLRAVDAETRIPLVVDTGRMTVSLPGPYGVRLAIVR